MVMKGSVLLYRGELYRQALKSWRMRSGKSCPHGLQVILVDGTYVRDHFDSDFSQGGNGFRYDFIPKEEIWVDQEINRKEWGDIIFHECEEVERMKKGMDYDHAHDEAKALEDRRRHQETE